MPMTWKLLRKSLIIEATFIEKSRLRKKMAKTTVNETELLTLAKDTAAREGWLWTEPIRITQVSEQSWKVRTNADKIGGNIEIEINAKTMQITRKVFLPR